MKRNTEDFDKSFKINKELRDVSLERQKRKEDLKELIDYTFEKLNRIRIVVQDDMDSGDTILYLKYNEE